MKSDDKSISVMAYNVRNLNKNEQLPLEHVDSTIIDFVLKESPDILSVQESHYAMRRETRLDKIYPNKFVNFEYEIQETNVINSLYSKHPIVEHGVIDFPKSDNSAIFADLIIEQDTVRIYNFHLQSFSVVPDVELLQSEESGKLVKRITRRLRKQEEQVDIVRQHMENCKYPVILTGDLNNTQFSKVYRKMRRGFNDSFLEAGSGFGRTFKLFGMPMRIDYIFADENFEVTSHTNYDIELSDHYPVMATLRLLSQE